MTPTWLLALGKSSVRSAYAASTALPVAWVQRMSRLASSRATSIGPGWLPSWTTPEDGLVSACLEELVDARGDRVGVAPVM
jgi:hypothetical protein